ncbi:hypothetical protein AIW35_24425, partial [Salmonella enterica]|nr:hypothetical protein [Salmonella enterica subsp. enterica serovar Typhimurium]EBA5414741.1 hypothetical protein [Salmonella enterica]ECI4191309.1 hypothetical protein [Salmonella enterica subsp. enterica]EAB5975782.1 hypothetical protein [Salmonella enterica subsp. enterica serovar Typhimurium]ECJ8402313.1 hypothetical protein [Salmonella enterica]
MFYYLTPINPETRYRYDALGRRVSKATY